MTRFPTLAIATAAAIAAVGSAAPSAQRQTGEQHVYVSVTDRDGKPVADLAAGDVTVREDGVAREVLSVAPAPPPTHVSLVIDDSAAARPFIAELRRGLWAIVAAAQNSNPPPSVGLRTLGDRSTRAAAHTTSAEALQPVIDRLFSRPGSGAYFQDAIVDESNDLAALKAERPVIIAFVVEDGPEFSHHYHAQVEDALKKAGASLWTITMQGRNDLATESQEARERAMVLSDVAKASGGAQRAVLSNTALESAMAETAAAIGARYDVTYGRPDALVPPKRLEVRVNRSGTRVAATSWPGR